MKDLRSVWFQDLEEIGDVYEIEMRKRQVVINRPFQVGIAVYQMAQPLILQFYYNCLDRYLDRRDFKLMQMDTDSLYFGLSRGTLEDAVQPEMREEFEEQKKGMVCLGQMERKRAGHHQHLFVFFLKNQQLELALWDYFV